MTKKEYIVINSEDSLRELEKGKVIFYDCRKQLVTELKRDGTIETLSRADSRWPETIKISKMRAYDPKKGMFLWCSEEVIPSKGKKYDLFNQRLEEAGI